MEKNKWYAVEEANPAIGDICVVAITDAKNRYRGWEKAVWYGSVWGDEIGRPFPAGVVTHVMNLSDPLEKS